MSDHVQLRAEARTILGKRVRQLRRQGILPATVYGHNVEPASIQIDAHEFGSVLRHAGRGNLIDLSIGTERLRPVFIKQLAVDAKRNLIQHVEFFQANLREKMHSTVALHFVGESPAVKEGGIYLTALDHVVVESLPDDVPGEGLEVDLSSITEMNGAIHVSDLQLPAGVTMITSADELVGKVTPPVSEAELEESIADTTAPPVEAEPAPEEPETEA